MTGNATPDRVALVLPTIEELCEAMAATGDHHGFMITREANGFPQYAAGVLAMLKERAQ